MASPWISPSASRQVSLSAVSVDRTKAQPAKGPGRRRDAPLRERIPLRESWGPAPVSGEPASAKDGFLGKRPRVIDLAGEPPLATDDEKSLTYVVPHAKVFHHKPKPDDIDQGRVGDCFFVSALAAFAQRDPSAVKKHLAYVGSDRRKGLKFYDVTFYVRADAKDSPALLAKFPRAGPDTVDAWVGADGKAHRDVFIPVKVRIDNALPVDRDRLNEKGEVATRYADSHYADPKGRKSWVSLYEKAYATLRGGYDAIDEGGSSGDGMQVLTGRHSEEFVLLGGEPPDVIFQRLVDACQRGQLLTLETYSNGDAVTDGVLWALQRYDPPGPDGKPMFDPVTFRYTDMDMMDDDNGWTPDHAYTLLRAWVNERGVKMVELRNPGGDTRPPQYSNGKRDGHAIVPWDIARALFQNAFVGGPPRKR
jgi:hypothetical protein